MIYFLVGDGLITSGPSDEHEDVSRVMNTKSVMAGE